MRIAAASRPIPGATMTRGSRTLAKRASSPRSRSTGAVLIPRRKEPTLPRSSRTPLYPFVPPFYILVSTVIVGDALYERPMEGGLSINTVLAGPPCQPAKTGRPPKQTFGADRVLSCAALTR